MTIASVVLALLAATSNAASNVLQRKANLEEHSDSALSLKLIWKLLHNRHWVAGLGTVTLSFILQAAALGTGTLAGVQPIIVLELPFTLVAGSRFLGVPMHRREWGAVAAMTAGLAVLLAALDPRAARHLSLPPLVWAVGMLVTVGVLLGLVAFARVRRGPERAVLLGCATGIEFGLTAALMKGTTAAASSGIAAVFSSWTTYAMVGAGIGGMVLMQNALQAGRLVAAQPGITLLDPLTAIIWGVAAFGEQVNAGVWAVAAAVGAAAMVVGALTLARSPLLSEHTGTRSKASRAFSAPREVGSGERLRASTSGPRAS